MKQLYNDDKKNDDVGIKDAKFLYELVLFLALYVLINVLNGFVFLWILFTYC